MRYQSGVKIKLGDLVSYEGSIRGGIPKLGIGDFGLIIRVVDDGYNLTFPVLVEWDRFQMPMRICEIKLVRRNGNKLMTWL